MRTIEKECNECGAIYTLIYEVVDDEQHDTFCPFCGEAHYNDDRELEIEEDFN